MSSLSIEFDELHKRHRRATGRRALLLLVLVLLCVVMFIAYLSIGSGTLSMGQVIDGLLHPWQVPVSTRVILWQLRMPVACTAVLAGAGLAVAGSLMQLALNNPLAEPFTLGLSSAAGFGAATVLVFGVSIVDLGAVSLGVATSVSAFFWSMLVVVLIGLVGRYRRMRVEVIALIGIAIHFTFSSLLAFTQFTADADQLQSLVFWLLGSLQRTSWMQVGIDGVLLAIIMPLLLSRAWLLTSMASFGELATAIGVHVARTRFIILLAAALLAGSITATVGIVGFVGLVAPHIARLLVGEDQRFCLCTSAACGALIMLVAGIASQALIPGAILPIGMLTALLGVPFFLWLILRRKNGLA